MRWRRPGGASTVWGVVDQAVASGNNFLLLLLTVRSVDARDFGAFSLVYLLYVLAVPVARATGTTPFTIRHVRDDPSALTAATAAVVRYAFGLGAVLGALCLLGATLLAPPVRAPLAILGAALPLLLVQDTVRGVLFAREEPRRAVRNDVLWGVLQLGVVAGASTVPGPVQVWVFVAAWAGAGAVAGAVGVVQLGLHSRRKSSSPVAWLSEHADLVRPLLLTTLLTVAPVHLAYLLMPLVSTLDELGTVRAVYVLFGPMNVAFTAATMLALPAAVRLPAERVRPFSARLSVSLAAFAAVWGIAVVAAPPGLGELVLGESWAGTAEVRLLLAVSIVAEGVMVGPTTAVAALDVPERVARVRCLTAPLVLAGALALAAASGAAGMALALAAGYSLTTLLAWFAVPSRPAPRG